MLLQLSHFSPHLISLHPAHPLPSVYVNQTSKLHNLNLHSDEYQLFLNKTREVIWKTWQKKKDLVCNTWQFPCCKNSYYGQFQATNMMSLNAEL